jgi:hypothetical protein
MNVSCCLGSNISPNSDLACLDGMKLWDCIRHVRYLKFSFATTCQQGLCSGAGACCGPTHMDCRAFLTADSCPTSEGRGTFLLNQSCSACDNDETVTGACCYLDLVNGSNICRDNTTIGFCRHITWSVPDATNARFFRDSACSNVKCQS